VAPLTIPPLVPLAAGDSGLPTARVTVRPVELRHPGDRVEVEWHGRWYSAVLLAPRGDGWLVHYDGYDDSWDEAAREDRIREP
jgi:hypothetical protein